MFFKDFGSLIIFLDLFYYWKLEEKKERDYWLRDFKKIIVKLRGSIYLILDIECIFEKIELGKNF